MKILLNLIPQRDDWDRQFILESLIQHSQLKSDNRLTIVTDSSKPEAAAINHIEQILLKPPAHRMAFSLWGKTRLEPIIKKNAPDFIVGWQPSGYRSASKFIGVVSPADTIGVQNRKQQSIIKHLERLCKKAYQIIVFSNAQKDWIIAHLPDTERKVSVIYRLPSVRITSLDFEERESVKEKYTGGDEYFLVSCGTSAGQLTTVLKGFSGFKKWQKSNMKCIINFASEEEELRIEKLLAHYKYRDSVSVIPADCPDAPKIQAAAYAAVLPDTLSSDFNFLSHCIQNKVPALVPGSSIYEEIAGSHGLSFQFDNKESVTATLLRVFKDEALRNKLIKQQSEALQKFEGYDATAEWSKILLT